MFLSVLMIASVIFTLMDLHLEPDENRGRHCTSNSIIQLNKKYCLDVADTLSLFLAFSVFPQTF